ncbi:MAG: hypothetical protein K0Q49_712 [Haloplasmataceae bacterium]|jgi:hypothetical protein|nr:hypothetical protein [Haloplasmataceae bacterium]
MRNIKEYSLTNEIKRKLGFIIKTTRTNRQKEYQGLIEKNPYTKENFCKETCHYHTLTKLENGIIKEDMIYHIFLDKLGFYFQIEVDEHLKNLEIIYQLVKKLLIANEYLDDDLLNNIIIEFEKNDFSKDCIADLHLKLLKHYSNLQKFNQSETEFKLIESYLLFYDDIYLGMAYHYLGLSYLKRRNINKSEELLFNAREIYEKNNVSRGIVNPNIINIYEYKKEYLNAVNLCFEMENYFLESKNFKRLIHTYNFLSYFYLMINDFNTGERYYNKCMMIIDNNESLLRYKGIIQYNFGVYIFSNFGIKESEKFLISSYKTSQLKEYKFLGKIVSLIIMTSLKYCEKEIIDLLNDGVEEDKNETHNIIYRYFKYKYEKPGYHRKYALEKLIPYLKERKLTEELLFIYEDLYG